MKLERSEISGFEALIGGASVAASDYVPPSGDLPDALAELDYDGYRRIAYDPERSVWRGNESFALQAFHMGWLFRTPVNVHAVSGGVAEPVGFSPADFIYREPLDAARIPGSTSPRRTSRRPRRPSTGDRIPHPGSWRNSTPDPTSSSVELATPRPIPADRDASRQPGQHRHACLIR